MPALAMPRLSHPRSLSQAMPRLCHLCIQSQVMQGSVILAVSRIPHSHYRYYVILQIIVSDSYVCYPEVGMFFFNDNYSKVIKSFTK